ncbi:MAG: tyrosine--tRNA ligase, partial [Clostridia bacterium]|nr:tyrosine--tRNA ligase [Clostridia bacterium]
NRPLNIKLGLDPSAPDVHLGHCVVLRKIRQLQNLGHEATIIIGDFTGMIGDPTGKSKTRKPLTKEQILQNAKTYEMQIFKILDKNKTKVRFNSDWLENMNLKDVLSLASKCTVAKMLEREDFKSRYINHQSICLHEFLYPLMQGYDSVAIKADIEFGGVDQTFNVFMGRSIQKDFGLSPQLVVLFPILEGIDGKNKMSKSLNNYIGINEEPNSMYVKVMKVPDDLIIRYFTFCTDIHPSEIQKIEKALSSGENPRNVKMQLALEITTLYHGEDKALEAQKYFETVYQKEQIPENVSTINVENLTNSEGVNLINAIAQIGDFKSKSDIRRIFSQRGAKIDGTIVDSIDDIRDLKPGTIIQIGKSKFYKISGI